jgi:predicted MFS family arabinose efflux permease
MPADGPPRLPLCGLLALAAAAFTDVVTDLLPAGLLPQMSRGLHVPEARAGLLVSAFAVASAVAAIPVTAAMRGLPRRPVLAGVLAGFALMDAVTAVSSSYLLTFATRLIAGVLGGTLWSMLAGYAARMVPAARRGRAIAIVLAGITAALCLGLPAATALAGLAGWRASFAVLAAVAALLVAWVRWRVPGFPGEAAASRAPLRGVAALPGVRPVLAVTFALLTGHQAMYTYIAPFTRRSGFGHTSLVLLVFGTATAAGIVITGILADRHLRPVLLAALALVAAAMVALGWDGRSHAVLLLGVALWGAAFGGAPTLLQTALIDASSPANADVATSMQTTVYNIGIAAGSLAGSLILQSAGAGALPWAASLLAATGLAAVATARYHAFPAGPRRAASRSVIGRRTG